MSKLHTKINIASGIPDTIEKRIVDLSLQYPDFRGVRLFQLLKQEDINTTVPTVYTILKRHGLQSREERFARSQVKQAVKELRMQAQKPSITNRLHEEKIPPPHDLPIKRVPINVRARGSWRLTALNVLLLILLVFSGVYAAKNTRSAILEKQPVTPADSSHNGTALYAKKVAVLPMSDYQMIWERSLFGISEKVASVPKIKTVSKELPLAKKDIGLILVGTVVSDDLSLNRALIGNLTARNQGIYSVGNRIDHILIKNIMNDRIIINAGRGDEVLEMRSPLTAVAQVHTDKQPVAQSANLKHRMGSRHRTVTLSRDAVVSALSNIDRTLDNVYISSGKVFNRQTGFRITSFEKDTIFSQLGLRNGDLVLSVNDQKINSPEQAKTFFHKIRGGGSLDVKVRRRARTRHIHLNIQ